MGIDGKGHSVEDVHTGCIWEKTTTIKLIVYNTL